MALEYALLPRGPADDGAVAARRLRALVARLRDRRTSQFHVQPLSLDSSATAAPVRRVHGQRLQPAPVEPRHGTHARAPIRAAPPRSSRTISSTDEDRRVAVDALRLTRRDRRAAARSPATAPEEYTPGAHLTTDDELRRRRRATSARRSSTRSGPRRWASRRSARRARRAPARARGRAACASIDASAMPRITSGNTDSPTSCSPKGREIVLGRARLSAGAPPSTRTVDNRVPVRAHAATTRFAEICRPRRKILAPPAAQKIQLILQETCEHFLFFDESESTIRNSHKNQALPIRKNIACRNQGDQYDGKLSRCSSAPTEPSPAASSGAQALVRPDLSSPLGRPRCPASRRPRDPASSPA